MPSDQPEEEDENEKENDTTSCQILGHTHTAPFLFKPQSLCLSPLLTYKPIESLLFLIGHISFHPLQ